MTRAGLTLHSRQTLESASVLIISETDSVVRFKVKKRKQVFFVLKKHKLGQKINLKAASEMLESDMYPPTELALEEQLNVEREFRERIAHLEHELMEKEKEAVVLKNPLAPWCCVLQRNAKKGTSPLLKKKKNIILFLP